VNFFTTFANISARRGDAKLHYLRIFELPPHADLSNHSALKRDIWFIALPRGPINKRSCQIGFGIIT